MRRFKHGKRNVTITNTYRYIFQSDVFPVLSNRTTFLCHPVDNGLLISDATLYKNTHYVNEMKTVKRSIEISYTLHFPLNT